MILVLATGFPPVVLQIMTAAISLLPMHGARAGDDARRVGSLAGDVCLLSSCARSMPSARLVQSPLFRSCRFNLLPFS